MLGRVASTLLVIGALVFAVEGGEYSSTDLLRQRSQRRRTVATIDSLLHRIDSLTKLKRAIATDAALQERIARERYGMVKGDKELMYRFVPATDSARP